MKRMITVAIEFQVPAGPYCNGCDNFGYSQCGTGLYCYKGFVGIRPTSTYDKERYEFLTYKAPTCAELKVVG